MLASLSRIPTRVIARQSNRTVQTFGLSGVSRFFSTTPAYFTLHHVGATATPLSTFSIAQRNNLSKRPSCRTFSTEVSDDSKEVLEKIGQLVKDDPVVLFMKGTPEKPMCGFSNAVVRVLAAEGAKYAAYNVLENDDLRQGIKDFSNWPTIPQLYVKGEFIGGCDITLDLFRKGELTEILRGAGAVSGEKPAASLSTQ